MPAPDLGRCRIAPLIGVFALLAMAGCEQAPAPAAGRDDGTAPATSTPLPTSPPAAPNPGNGYTQSSYEVTIATAAANHKQAMTECNTRPEAERENCLAQVEVDWQAAKAAADDLRGFAQ